MVAVKDARIAVIGAGLMGHGIAQVFALAGHDVTIYDAVKDATGRRPVLIDSDALVAHPFKTIAAYCAAVGIPFIPQALTWRPRMEDAWRRTSKWHEMASQTSGFVPTSTLGWDQIKDNPLLVGYFEYHLPFYEKLRDAAITI